MSRKQVFLWVVGILVVAVTAAGLAFVIAKPEQRKTVAPLVPIPPATSTEVSSSQATPPPLIRHDAVAQAMPTSLKVWKEGELPLLGNGSPNMDPNPAKMNAAGKVLPNTTELPAVQNDPNLDWAVLPGTGVGTTVIVCHALANENLPCNALTSIPSGSNATSGYQAELTLPTGTLRAELTNVYLPPKEGGGSAVHWAPLFTKEPDRWFVVMCDLERDPNTGKLRDTYASRMLEFHLVESISAS